MQKGEVLNVGKVSDWGGGSLYMVSEDRLREDSLKVKCDLKIKGSHLFFQRMRKRLKGVPGGGTMTRPSLQRGLLGNFQRKARSRYWATGNRMVAVGVGGVCFRVRQMYESDLPGIMN